jgi:adenylate cyclase class 2
LKARDPHPERSLGTCGALGAEGQAVLRQRDTYFDARHGRLKLREEEGAAAHLIAYRRPDVGGRRESRYRIAAVAEPDQLKAALADTLGIRAVVVKERQLFLWDGVRIHLDRVDGLGDFIEFEAIAASASAGLSDAEAQVEALRQAFEIADVDLIGESYCDLALAGPAPG